VEATVGYLAEVFCTGEPFFGVVSPPEQVDAGVQMESVIGDNSRRFGWRAEYIKCFRDGLKYNLWQWRKHGKEERFSIINDPTQRTEKAACKQRKCTLVTSPSVLICITSFLIRESRRIKCTRDGEFCGYVELYPRTRTQATGHRPRFW
jgi:hypothetical protein